jgi:hypothetical protein
MATTNGQAESFELDVPVFVIIPESRAPDFERLPPNDRGEIYALWFRKREEAQDYITRQSLSAKVVDPILSPPLLLDCAVTCKNLGCTHVAIKRDDGPTAFDRFPIDLAISRLQRHIRKH